MCNFVFQCSFLYFSSFLLFEENIRTYLTTWLSSCPVRILTKSSPYFVIKILIQEKKNKNLMCALAKSTHISLSLSLRGRLRPLYLDRSEYSLFQERCENLLFLEMCENSLYLEWSMCFL